MQKGIGAQSRRVFAASLLMLLPGMLPAQELSMFRLFPWHGSLRFRYQNEQRLATQFAKERSYRETLKLNNRGYVISPRLLLFTWNGDFGLYQEKYDIPLVRTRLARTRFLSQSLNLSFFRQSSRPFQIIYDRNINTLKLDYGGRTDYEVTTLQATLDLLSSSLVSRLHASRRQIDENWSRESFISVRNQVRHYLTYSGTRSTDNSSLRINYRFFRNANRIDDALTYSTHTGTVRHMRTFGKEQQHEWANEIDMYLQNGSGAYSSIKGRQIVTLQHSPSLKSMYRYTLSLRNSLLQTTLQNSGSVSLTHKLYSSLVTTLGTGGFIGTSTFGNFYTGQVNGGVNYTKKLPYDSRLQLGYSRSLASTNRRVESTIQSVADEKHIFWGELPIVLNERYVLTQTIRVYDEESRLLFQEGMEKDYYIRVIDSRVEIHRTLLGRIRENSTVVVSYQFRTLPSQNYATDSRNSTAQIVTPVLVIYFRENRHDISIRQGPSDGERYLGDLYNKTIGVRTSWRGRRAGLFIFAEQTEQESRLYAYTLRQLTQSVFFIPAQTLTMTAGFTLSDVVYKNSAETLRMQTFNSELRWKPTLDLVISGTGRYRLRDDSVRGREENYELILSAQRTWRVLRLLLRYEQRYWQYVSREIREKRFTVELERIF